MVSHYISRSTSTRRLTRQMPHLLVLAALYAVTSLLSTWAFQGEGQAVVPIWPPAGIGVVIILWFGLGAWPAVAIGALVGQLLLIPTQVDSPHLAFLTFSVFGNTAGPVAAVLLTRGLDPISVLRGRAGPALGYILCAFVLASVSTLFGVTGLLLASAIAPEAQWPTALDWFVGDVFGVAIFGPAVLALCERWIGKRDNLEQDLARLRRIEKLIWSAALILGCWIWLGYEAISEPYRLALMVVPAVFLGWSALRFDTLFTSVACLIVAVCLLSVLRNTVLLPPPIARGDQAALVAMLLGICSFPVLVASAVRRLRITAGALRHQSLHDHLTAIGNRRQFEKRLNGLLAAGDRSAAVAIIDIDNFRLTNERGGQTCGDSYLKQAAVHLSQAVRSEETLCRLSGDEFGVILAAEDYATRIDDLRRVVSGMRLPWGDQLISLRASAGGVVAPAGSEMRDALQAASIACKEAKERGGDRTFAGDLSLIRGLPEKKAVAWAGRINEALDRDMFTLHAQLIRPTKPNRKARLEVLVRMLDEAGGLIAPGNFIPVAERFRQIQRVDRWVIESSIRWLAENLHYTDWLDCLSINLSGPTMSDAGFDQAVVDLVEQYAVPAHRLSFEITERVAISDLSVASRFVDRMRELGCKFALDDFGAGVSSFSYLKALKMDTIKIDGSFIEGMMHDRVDQATVESIRDIANLLELVTVAEHVSSPEILTRVEQLGLDYAQGHAVGRATDLNTFCRPPEVVSLKR